jgi:hypothetical protein
MYEYKYPHEIKINGTLYHWYVSESHIKGRRLCTAREMWVCGGRIPARTKFSVGAHLTKSHLNHIIRIIRDDQIIIDSNSIGCPPMNTPS